LLQLSFNPLYFSWLLHWQARLCRNLHDDFLQWLQLCVTGLDHPMVLPANPMYLDTLLGGQEMWGGVVPKIGRNFVQVVSIEGFHWNPHPAC
jgi:hypothetical protein